MYRSLLQVWDCTYAISDLRMASKVVDSRCHEALRVGEFALGVYRLYEVNLPSTLMIYALISINIETRGFG